MSTDYDYDKLLGGLVPVDNSDGIHAPSDDPHYRDEDVRARATTVVELCRTAAFEPTDQPPGLLAVYEREPRGHLVSFACFKFAMSNTDGTECLWVSLFHGHGFGSCGPEYSLRECRHTYWGPSDTGYIFYPPADIIIAALTELKRWFDME